MIVSHKHKFIYMKTRKTASSSIQAALTIHCGKDDVIAGSNFSNGAPDDKANYTINCGGFGSHPHETIGVVKRGMDRLYPGEWENYFKFTFVRNPWDIVVSRYHWDKYGKNTSKIGFLDWVKSNKIPAYDRGDIYYAIDGKIALDFIGKYENLSEDLKYIENKLNITLDLPQLKSGYRSSRNYREFYDEQSKDIVANIFKNDIDNFGYKF